MKATDSKKLDHIISMLGDVVEVFGKRFDTIDTRMAASEKRLTETEKRPADRIDGVGVKVDGLQNEFDARAIERVGEKLPERVADLEKHAFGASRAPRLPRRA